MPRWQDVDQIAHVEDRWNQQDAGRDAPGEGGAEVEDDRDLSGDGFPFP